MPHGTGEWESCSCSKDIRTRRSDGSKKRTSENARLAFVHAYLAAGYALKDNTERARAELSAAQGLSKAYSSLSNVEKSNWFDEPKIRALAETTYFPGLRKAGMPEG